VSVGLPSVDIGYLRAQHRLTTDWFAPFEAVNTMSRGTTSASLIRGAISALLLMGMLIPGASASPTRPSVGSAVELGDHGPMSYQHPCNSGLQYSHSVVQRGGARGFLYNDIVGAIGDAAVRTQLPCSSATSLNFDYPMVWPAVLQDSASSSRIVQIGYTRCGKPTGQLCNDILADGTQHFTYVCNDVSGGTLCDAKPWAGTPVLGRRYRFRVQYNQLGTGKWDYSIKDLTTGVTKTKSIASSWHNADGAWYGGENTDTGSVMASAHSGSNDIQLYWMQYLSTTVGAWNVVTDISATSTPADFVELGAQPSWYGYTIFSQNYTLDGINVWSSSHL
jgi:hypothetical protein